MQGAGRLIDIHTARLALQPGRHPLEAERREAIGREWAGLVAGNARLHDGEALLGTRVEIGEGRIDGACQRIRYAGLVHFLGSREALPYRHVHANAALVSCDGRAIMGRMAGHTMNSGRIYFPAGSLEPQDFTDGLADFEANMAREVMEETGLDLARAEAAPGFLAFVAPRHVALLRVYRFAQPAAELLEQGRAHLARGGEDELAALLAFEPGQVDPAMPEFVRAFMARFAG